MKISLIAAIASNRVIGNQGQMPWHLSADLKRFKQITLGAPVMMGRKTFDAIGKPLPGRQNIIISHNLNYKQPNCLTFTDISLALKNFQHCPELFIIGGATLYQAMLPFADYLYLTVINKNFSGDTFFPEIDYSEWHELDKEDVDDDKTVDFTYSYIKYEHLLVINKNKSF